VTDPNQNPVRATGQPDPRTRDEWLLLALIGAGDISAAQHLWESHSPKNLRGMLTGADGWTWDDQQQAYLSRTGRKVGNSDLKTIALMFALAIEHDLRIETSNMAVGLLALDEWQRRMADTVKDLNVVEGALGAGGFGSLSPDLVKTIEGEPSTPPGLSYSIDRLYDFARDATAADATEDQVIYRSGLYAAASNGTFEDVKRESHRGVVDEKGRLKYLFERNMLGESLHCRTNGIEVGCIECSDAGWVPIGSLPLPGLRPCAMRCRCSMVYSLVGDELGNN
jgi:hypothetical protein